MTREEAIFLLEIAKEKFNETFFDYGRTRDAIDMAIEALKGRPQGEWIETYDASRLCGFDTLACSVCGKELLPNVAVWYNYCPNCGAKMEG